MTGYANKRYLLKNSIATTKEFDGTTNLSIMIDNALAVATIDGTPTLLHFYITKNKNRQLTKENGLLDLKIPIIPMTYNINSSRSLSDFITKGQTPAKIIEQGKDIPVEVVEKNIASYRNKILNYIKMQIALRYALAKENNDINAMNILFNLSCMQDFDLELTSLLAKNPVQIIENNKPTSQDNKYILVYEDGSVSPISKNQYRSVSKYMNMFNSFDALQSKMMSLSKVLSDYEMYDITHEKFHSTVPTHSIIVRGVSPKTNTRVSKPKSASNSNKKTKSNTKKEKQPNDEE